MSETVKRITTNFAYFLSGELMAKFLGYLAIVFLARKLGADGFGHLGFAEAFFSYFIYIGIAGVDTIATRKIARDKSLAVDHLGNVMSLKLLLCLLAYLLLTVLTLIVRVSLELRYLTMLYGLCLLPIALSTEWLFQGLERMKYIGLFRVLREAAFLSGVLLVLLSSGNIYYVPAARVAAMMVAVIFLFLVIRRLGLQVSFKMNLRLWKSLLRQSYPLLGSQLLIIIIYNFSILLLGLIGKTEEIGYFSAIQKIVLFVFGLAGVFWAVIFPNISRLYADSKERLVYLENAVSKVVAGAAVPLAIIGYAHADGIVTFLYSDDYVRSVEVFEVLIWVAGLGFINGIFAQGLLACDNQGLFFKTVFVQTLVSVVMVLILVPRYGALGASISWLCAEAVGFFVYKGFFNRIIVFNFYRYLAKPILASSAVAVGSRYLGSYNIILTLCVCLVTYFGIMFVIKGIEVRELRLVYRSLVTK